MSVTSTVARNTGVQVFGRLCYMLLSLLMVKVLTGYLGEAGFGKYSIAVDYLGFFGVLVDLGLYLIIVQKISTTPDQTEKERVVGNIIGLRLLSITVATLLACLFIFVFPYENSLQWGIVAASLGFLFVSVSQLFAGIFQAYLRAEFAAVIEVISRSIIFILVVICSLQKLPLMAVFLTLIIGNGIGLAFAWVVAGRFIRIRVRFDMAYYREILRDAAPLGLILAISYLYVRQATIILSLHPVLPAGLTNEEAVGIYKAPFKLLETVQGIPALFLVSLFPFLSKYIVENDSRLPSMLQKAFDFLIGLAIPLLVGTMLLASQLIPVITSGGEGWARAISCLQILIVAIAFSFLNNFSGHVIIAKKAQRRLIWPNLFYLVVNLLLNILLIPYFAYNGSAMATVVTELCVVIVNFSIIRSLLHWQPRLTVLGKICLAAGVMGVVVYGMQQLGMHLLIIVCTAMIVYFFLLDRLGGLPEGLDLKGIGKKIRGA